MEDFWPNQKLTFNSPDTHLGGVTYGGYRRHDYATPPMLVEQYTVPSSNLAISARKSRDSHRYRWVRMPLSRIDGFESVLAAHSKRWLCHRRIACKPA